MAHRHRVGQDRLGVHFAFLCPCGEKRDTVAFHRPLSWYSKVLQASGLAITALEEPEPTDEFMEKERDAAGFLEVPHHLVIEARKLSTRAVPYVF